MFLLMKLFVKGCPKPLVLVLTLILSIWGWVGARWTGDGDRLLDNLRIAGSDYFEFPFFFYFNLESFAGTRFGGPRDDPDDL